MLHLQGAKFLKEYRAPPAKPWPCPSHLLIFLFSLANPRNGLLRNDQKVHRSLRGHIPEYKTLGAVTGQRPSCYFHRLGGIYEIPREWVLRAPHLLVLIQDVSWEAPIQDPGEDGWGCPPRSCLLGLGNFIPISHTCSSSDLQVGQTHPKEEAGNTSCP